jgi:hypothetical protein
MGRRQFGSVRKLPSGRWQASYWHAGIRHIAQITKADANAYLAAVETQIRRGSWIDPWAARMPLAYWAEEWRATIVDLRPSTKVRDLGYLERYLLPRFGDMELGRIDHMAVRTWVAELSASGLSPATTTKAAQILSKMMKAAVQAGLLLKSPCDGVRLPRIERVEMRFLNATEVRALANAIDPRYEAAVLLAAYGGLRAGELFGLRAKRVDPLRRTITIAETLVDVGGHPYFGPPKTRAGHRTIPLPRAPPARWPSISPPTGASPTISSSPPPREARYNSTSGGDGSGLQRSVGPVWPTCGHMISGTPPWRCGSPPGPTPRKRRPGPATRRSASRSTATDTSSPAPSNG